MTMRSWTTFVIRAAAGAALFLVPAAVGAQQAGQRPVADSMMQRPAAPDTGTAKRGADSVAAKPSPADTGVAKRSAPDSAARQPMPADTGAAKRPDADSVLEKASVDSLTEQAAPGSTTEAAVDTGKARRVGAGTASGRNEPMEHGLIRRPDPLGPFTKEQTQYSRVLAARIEKRFEIKKLYRERGIEYPAAEVFIRIFKRERELELWVRPTSSEQFALLKTYPICALAGELGPKQFEGDGQTPEGFYFIDRFNPTSEYHLSLHLDYPNRADRALWKSPNPGGEIFIHGGCNSAGCMAVTDDAIKEIYWIAVEARSTGQRRIPVHIFPTRLDDRSLDQLVRVFANEPALTRFWSNLKTGYDYFERTRTVPGFSVSASGRYALKNQMLGAPVAGSGSDTGSGSASADGLLGKPLTPARPWPGVASADSARSKAAVPDSTVRPPVLPRPLSPDSARRGG